MQSLTLEAVFFFPSLKYKRKGSSVFCLFFGGFSFQEFPLSYRKGDFYSLPQGSQPLEEWLISLYSFLLHTVPLISTLSPSLPLILLPHDSMALTPFFPEKSGASSALLTLISVISLRTSPCPVPGWEGAGRRTSDYATPRPSPHLGPAVQRGALLWAELCPSQFTR